MRVTEYTMELNDEKIPSLVKERSKNYATLKTCNTPKQIDLMMRDVYKLERQAEEHLYMLAFTTKMSLLGVFEISHGTVNGSVVTPREIFMRAFSVGAFGIVLVHNHPSGVPEPSEDDKKVTKRIQKAGDLMGISLLDHIIMGESTYYSFLENK